MHQKHPEAKTSLPTDFKCPTPEIVEKTVITFHCESIFSANEDQRTQWETHTIKPKSKGAGIQKNVCQENGSNSFHQRGECTNSSSQNVPSTTDLKCPTRNSGKDCGLIPL